MIPVILLLGPQRYFSHGPFTPLTCAITSTPRNHTFAPLNPDLPYDSTWERNINVTVPGCQTYPLHGYAIAEMEHLMRAFLHNFKVGDEVGAQLVAYIDGKKVVDVAGGYKYWGKQVPYNEDDLQLVFSTSKSVTSLIVAWMVDHGYVDYDEKVVTYWPEFGQGNKSDVSISDVLGHRSGVTWVDEPVSPKVALDADALATIIERQPHNFKGETVQAYHAVTRGWILNEIIRRVDPAHRGASDILSQDILPTVAAKISEAGGIPPEFYFGVPDSELPRVTPLIGPPIPWFLYHLLLPARMQRDPVPSVMADAVLSRSSPPHKSLIKSFKTNLMKGIWPYSYNDPDILKGKNGLSYGGVTNARSIGTLAAYLAGNGTFNGHTLLSASTLATALEQLPQMEDSVVGFPISFTKGGWGKFDFFGLDMEGKVISPRTIGGWYGWMGSGGSMMFFHPQRNLAFTYVMNGARPGSLGDRRCRDLLRAFLEAYEAMEDRKIATASE
ncbi:beta-lactamase/transpeptidase-like protein [Cladochytrium replicatum]|nr:beta-lactamase/transpeptidase-like protein [Cladochytrium replicatum]